MDYEARQPARPRSLWPARPMPPSQPQQSAFGRQGIPPARRFPSTPRGLHSRLPSQGLGSQRQPSPGRGTSGSWQRSLPPSQTTAAPVQSLRDRVDAALAYRQALPASQQQCTDSLPLEGSQLPADSQLPYDALQDVYGSQAQDVDQLHLDSLQSQSRYHSQLPERASQRLDSQPVPSSMHSDMTPPRLQLTATQVPPTLPTVAAVAHQADAAVQCDPPQAPAAPPADPALAQQVGQLVESAEQTRAELAQLAQGASSQQTRLTGLQNTCTLILKAVQAVMTAQQQAQVPRKVLHECVVQTGAGPQCISTAAQTLVPAQHVSAGVQTSQLHSPVCSQPAAVADAAQDAAVLSAASGLRALQCAAQASDKLPEVQQGQASQHAQLHAGMRMCY